MKVFQFGDPSPSRGYNTLDERVVRATSGLMLLLACIATINGFILEQYRVIPWISGFLALNFALAVLINPKLAPLYALARLIVIKQTPLPIGAVQKRFAWSLGLLLTGTVFTMSFQLLNDASWFDRVCSLCMLCILLLFLETSFGICVGCKLYYLGIRLKLIKAPKVQPNCMGDSCAVD